MACDNCRREFQSLVSEGVLTPAQWAAIDARLSRDSAPPALPGAEAPKTFSGVMVLYYAGALLILSAFGWFLGSHWKDLGHGGVLFVSAVYAALFALLARVVLRQENYPVAGGLLATCAVGMAPLISYSLLAWLNLWPMRNPGAYHGYYVWINGSWVVVELFTLLATFVALRSVRFSFLVMPAAIALWFFSMDAAEIVFMTHDLGRAKRSIVSMACGLVFLAAGRLADQRGRGVDYAFWIDLAGLLAFWGGLTAMPSSGELGKLAYCAINIALIGAALRLDRRTFAVFGAMGVFGYVGHLAWDLFKDSALFPIALASTGLFMILLTVFFQKNYGRLQAIVRPGYSRL